MKKMLIPMPTTAIISGLLIITGALTTGGPAWGAPGPAAPPPALFQRPLNQVPVPEPPNLFQFVKNKQAAIKLGKALFWDMQVGSDGVQACGSCHFSAGTDNRLKNTVNPGSRAGDTSFQVRGPNETLLPADFPFHQRQNPDFQASPILRDANDVVGSQGVRFADFVAINAGSAVDSGTPKIDPVFHLGANPNLDPANNTRRVTARNTPTIINAVFNFHNFWDGRAHYIFNGVNPFGPLDTGAGVWFNDPAAGLVKRPIAIEAASLASQATGPPLDDTEMSFSGRTFPQLGKKMLSLTPLGKQLVHPGDSVLGPLSRAVVQPSGKITGANGLSASYTQMIRDAFVNELWNATPPVTLPEGQFTQMEANFSLFWGLAIQLYEATLVSDQTPFDRFLGGDQAALTPQQGDGMNIFFGAGKCDACHGGTELTSASVTAAAFISNIENGLIDQMPVASGEDTIYDIGFNATGVRPMTDDTGRGGDSPFTNPLTGQPTPLSYSAQAEIQRIGNLPFETVFLPPQIPANFPVSNDGAFKVPGLRNVELTAPYFHDGSVMTLEDVVDFYSRGGNFPAVTANPDLDFNITEIGALQNNPAAMAAMVEFMKALTDERVRNGSAPFDHPEIFIPEGDPEVLRRIPARDASGNAAPMIALTLDQVPTPTNRTSLLIGGTKEAGSSVLVKVNDGAAAPAGTAADTSWSATVGLTEGNNSITVTATDLLSEVTTVTASVTVDATPPLLTLNPVTATTKASAQTISGTVEAGLTLTVTAGTAATVGPVTVTGATWSAPLSGLAAGANNITIVAVDPAGNVATRTAAITVVLADGDIDGGGAGMSDTIRALRVAVGLNQPSPDDLIHGDVAPLGAPDGKIDVADALMILKKVVGLISL